MADLIDRANDQAEQMLQRQIEAARNSNGMQVGASRECLNCGAGTKDGARWCSTDCRDDYIRRHPEPRAPRMYR